MVHIGLSLPSLPLYPTLSVPVLNKLLAILENTGGEKFLKKEKNYVRLQK